MAVIRDMLLQLFFALMPFVMYNIYYRDKTQNYSQRFIMITSMISLFLSMTFSLSAVSGVYYDIRYIIIYFGMIYGGIQTMFILIAEFVIYRIYIGGEGTWVAMVIMLQVVLLTLLLYRIHKKTRRFMLVTISAGVIFSIIPFVTMYSFYRDYVMDHLTFNILALPVLNAVGIWLLISLFNKSVAEKELFISFAQHEKSLALNHVAASLAHEVRNPLTAVKGFLQLIRENSQSEEKINRYIEISTDEIKRTETILSEYLSISKPLKNRRELVHLSKQLQIILDVMTPFANMNNVQIIVENTDQSTRIFANAEELKQVLMNFVKNAIEACSHSSNGKVLITSNVEDSKVILKISDNGIGMTHKQIKRLGTFYFSTKSSGTGLGLTFSYQVIRSLSGSVSVRSEPREGTVFTIILPIASEKKYRHNYGLINNGK